MPLKQVVKTKKNGATTAKGMQNKRPKTKAKGLNQKLGSVAARSQRRR